MVACAENLLMWQSTRRFPLKWVGGFATQRVVISCSLRGSWVFQIAQTLHDTRREGGASLGEVFHEDSFRH